MLKIHRLYRSLQYRLQNSCIQRPLCPLHRRRSRPNCYQNHCRRQLLVTRRTSNSYRPCLTVHRQLHRLMYTAITDNPLTALKFPSAQAILRSRITGLHRLLNPSNSCLRKHQSYILLRILCRRKSYKNQ